MKLQNKGTIVDLSDTEIVQVGGGYTNQQISFYSSLDLTSGSVGPNTFRLPKPKKPKKPVESIE